MSVEGRPVHRLLACATGPGRVVAAVTKASLMADEHLAGSEDVAVGQWVGGRIIQAPDIDRTSSPTAAMDTR